MNYNEYKELRSNPEMIVNLHDGFILRSNEYRQIFISRGGKKEYFLTDKFIKRYLID